MSNVSKREEEILDFWEEHQVFEKSVSQRPEDKPYVFYDGPPFATGLPHYGHILSSVIKDVVPRYWTMKGYRVRRRWGWDCHGLPIENLIEKKLQISGKKEINERGVEHFNEACREAVLTYTQDWKKMIRRIGRWVEFDTAYKTMDSTYMESVWWALKTIWNKGLIYEGLKVLLYCPRCETPVSKAEVAMDNSYQDITEESVIVKFHLKPDQEFGNGKYKTKESAYILAWTTTPWTLPGNVALAVGKDIKYTSLRIQGTPGLLIVARELVEVVFKGKEIEIVHDDMRGSDLIGLEYEPLFDVPAIAESGKRAYYVAPADFVTTQDGTGVVHTAVVYGEDDYNLGVALDLPMVQLLNERAEYNEYAPEFLRGIYIKQAEKEIKKYLESKGLLFAKQQHTHSYPRCWRCETTLIYNAIPAWFISIQKIKSRLIELNEKISWYPEHLKHGRFLNILETAPDWNISRNRYWATPLPFWRCIHRDAHCDAVICIGSVKELKEKALNFDTVFSGDTVADLDLHKHIVDQIQLRCDACGGTMERIPEVIDCWVESASMPFAEFHYPFENETVFKNRFPGQYIAEYIAQTRAWFYYMHVMATLLFDDISFQHCVTTGTILNEKGDKLSKSKMNYTDPWAIIDEYGVDALRYYLMTSVVMDADNLFFNDREVREVYNKVINMLGNVLEYYKMYAKEEWSAPANLKPHILDRWILSKTQKLVQDVTVNMDAYDTVRAGRPIRVFIDELSTWYLRRSRDRFKGDDEDQRYCARKTLGDVLEIVAYVSAPFTPFISEMIYKEVADSAAKHESVHLAAWPGVDTSLIDEPLEQEMEAVRSVVEMAHALRAECGMKLRQPLSMLVCNKELTAELADIIKDEVNVKEVRIAKDPPEGKEWIIKENGELRVALNSILDDQLKEEGMVRELIRQINAFRKDQKLTINDSIALVYHTDDVEMLSTLRRSADELCKNVLAASLEEGKEDDMRTITVEGKELLLSFRVV